MIAALLKFELKYHFNQMAFKIGAILFLVLGMVCVAKGGFGTDEVHKNSPYVITNIIALLSLFSIFSSTLFSANVVLRDAMYKIESVIFTTAITKPVYFVVRLLGLLIAVFTLLLLVAIGIFIGTFFVGGDQLGAFNIGYFLHALLVFALPNVIFSAGALYCTGLLTKNVRAIYVVGVLIYILYMLASIFGNSPLLATSALKGTTPDALPILLDPFGLASFFGETRTWTSAQRNGQLFPLTGLFLLNRLLWFTFSAILMWLTYCIFNFRVQRQKQAKQQTIPTAKATLIPFKHLEVKPNGLGYQLTALKAQFKLEMINLFKNIPVMVMLLLWVFLFGVELKDELFSGVYGIHSYPATGIIVEEIRSIKFALILIIFYAAESIAREKSVGIHSLIYSTPVRSWVMWVAKSMSLFALVFILVSLNIGIGITLQLSHGYFHIELPLYFSLYYYSAFPLILFVVLIVFIQNLSSNKYVGMMLSMVTVFIMLYADRFGLEHYLFRFATVPDLLHSYFNGFGYYATAFNWYMLYWAAFVTIIALLTIGMWQNKCEIKAKNRLKSVGLVLKQHKWIAIFALLTWISGGAYIYYESNVVSRYQNAKTWLNWQLAYEQQYKALANMPQPVIKSVKTIVDLYPDEGKYTVKGTYRLKNETEKPISKIWISLNPQVNLFAVDIAGAKKGEVDEKFKQQFITLNSPLLLGDTIKMSFILTVFRNGFTPFDKENSIVKNGSYIELEKFVPHLGYSYNFESDDKRSRKQYGLTEKPVEQTFSRNYELIDFETTISTNHDQQVLTVGELQKSWLANNRRYFSYKTPLPVNFMFALSSAQYEVKQEQYKGVALSIYYQQGQEYNLRQMFKGIKDALDYGNEHFAKYPLKQLTLAEIPQYKGAATAYPGIIFSAENINFLGNFSQQGTIDHSYAIAAHETAHQWWANKLAPFGGPGYAMLTESLAKYTENVLMEKAFGKMYLQQYLDYDNRLYFLNRNNTEKELPLAKTLNQAYVNYQKGGINMYAVKELMGEQKFNAVLKQLIADHAYPKPKASASDLVNALLKEALPAQKKFIDDCFNQVVTYDLGLKVQQCTLLKNGKYQLELLVNAERLSAGPKQLPDLEVEIGCFNQPEQDWRVETRPFSLQKYHISQNQTRLILIVDRKPKTVAIDPYRYLLDADKSDHAVEVK
ncbi:hypothetical protein DBR40_10510 [Pedobacter sp. KBW01]|uniref:ABC transporter permease/M1 family aminopeptidase n=1 Tax=Pedobacter sp. KBW01 TaxID=2153364 RepID=UPI000F59B434|nr:M1 family aminopeptidase [Pedobacter sp. KBW01]RQO77087.1 hypothetical protein DBR40_10510 [Pedobacter sp. KBW01]